MLLLFPFCLLDFPSLPSVRLNPLLPTVNLLIILSYFADMLAEKIAEDIQKGQ